MPGPRAASPLPLIVGVAHLRGVKATLRDAATVRSPFGSLPPVADRPGSVSSLGGLDTPGPPVSRPGAGGLRTGAPGPKALLLLTPTTGSARRGAPGELSSGDQRSTPGLLRLGGPQATMMPAPQWRPEE